METIDKCDKMWPQSKRNTKANRSKTKRSEANRNEMKQRTESNIIETSQHKPKCKERPARIGMYRSEGSRTDVSHRPETNRSAEHKTKDLGQISKSNPNGNLNWNTNPNTSPNSNLKCHPESSVEPWAEPEREHESDPESQPEVDNELESEHESSGTELKEFMRDLATR